MRSIFFIGLAAVMLVACTPSADPTVNLSGRATAGPVCPVESIPPDPACEPRAVAGAQIVVMDEAGESVARVTTADDGSFTVSLAPGSYGLVPQPVEGLLGTAPPVQVTVEEGVRLEPIQISYDTGIR